jgi:hypothetical protein
MVQMLLFIGRSNGADDLDLCVLYPYVTYSHNTELG